MFKWILMILLVLEKILKINIISSNFKSQSYKLISTDLLLLGNLFIA